MKYLLINYINYIGIGIVGIGYFSFFIFRGKKIIFILVFMYLCKIILNIIKYDLGRKNILKLKNI